MQDLSINILHHVFEKWEPVNYYYMNHQVLGSDFNDRRGIGGEHFAMALSSWNLLCVIQEMKLWKKEWNSLPIITSPTCFLRQMQSGPTFHIPATP